MLQVEEQRSLAGIARMESIPHSSGEGVASSLFQDAGPNMNEIAINEDQEPVIFGNHQSAQAPIQNSAAHLFGGGEPEESGFTQS